MRYAGAVAIGYLIIVTLIQPVVNLSADVMNATAQLIERGNQ